MKMIWFMIALWGSGTVAKMSILNNRNWIAKYQMSIAILLKNVLKKRWKKKKKIYKQELYLETKYSIGYNVEAMTSKGLRSNELSTDTKLDASYNV